MTQENEPTGCEKSLASCQLLNHLEGKYSDGLDCSDIPYCELSLWDRSLIYHFLSVFQTNDIMVYELPQNWKQNLAGDESFNLLFLLFAYLCSINVIFTALLSFTGEVARSLLTIAQLCSAGTAAPLLHMRVCVAPWNNSSYQVSTPMKMGGTFAAIFLQ